MTKALFFDIDGTLVSFKTHRIPESTIKSIRLAHENGYKIFISTGRPYMIINNIPEIQGKGIIDGYVTMNGAYCFLGDPQSIDVEKDVKKALKDTQILHKGSIEPKDVAVVADFCRDYDFSCIFVEESNMSVCRPSELVKSIFCNFLKVQSFPESDFESVKNKEIFQISPFITEQEERTLMERLQACELGRWHPAFADLTGKNNTKASGLETIMKEFGWDRSELMAFGDGGNDIPMLEYSGIGIAMGQADKRVRKSADYVTTSVDEDGIYNALRHFHII